MDRNCSIGILVFVLLPYLHSVTFPIFQNAKIENMGHIGFSYIGLIFLLMLFTPNVIWVLKKPQGYSFEKENKLLAAFERAGEIFTTTCALMFDDFNINGWSIWTLWLIAAFILMLMYDCWWICYFHSEQKQSDYYRSFLGIPLAGATLPVLSFFMLGIYGKVIWLMIASVILGIGHIGIHIKHKKSRLD